MTLFRRTAAALPALAALITSASLGAQQPAPAPRVVAAPLPATAAIDLQAAPVLSARAPDGRADDRFDSRDRERRDGERRGDGRDDRRDHRDEQQLFSWAGTVDRDLFIVVRGRDISTQGRDRDLPWRVRVNSGMPRSPGTLVIDVDEGRGNIGVIEQPSPRNGFQAVIRIQDPRGGADRYRLTAYWQDNDRRDWDRDWDRDRDRDGRGYDNRGYDNRGPNSDRGALQWSGRVDDVVEIRIQGRRVDYITRSGAPLRDVHSDMVGASLPRRPVDVFVERREGRGVIEVVQQPNARNDFTAVIRVDDPRGGAAFYDFNARWQ